MLGNRSPRQPALRLHVNDVRPGGEGCGEDGVRHSRRLEGRTYVVHSRGAPCHASTRHLPARTGSAKGGEAQHICVALAFGVPTFSGYRGGGQGGLATMYNHKSGGLVEPRQGNRARFARWHHCAYGLSASGSATHCSSVTRHNMVRCVLGACRARHRQSGHKRSAHVLVAVRSWVAEVSCHLRRL